MIQTFWARCALNDSAAVSRGNRTAAMPVKDLSRLTRMMHSVEGYGMDADRQGSQMRYAEWPRRKSSRATTVRCWLIAGLLLCLASLTGWAYVLPGLVDINTIAGNGTGGYGGDGGGFGASLDSASVSVSCSPGAITYGGSTTCTATVTGSSPTGTVTFTYNGNSWTSCALSNGSCSVSESNYVAVGSYTVTGSYSGDSNNTSAAGSTSVTINPAMPTISFWPTASAITYGQPLSSSTLSGGSANVSGSFAWTSPATTPGAGTPSENVTFTPSDTTDYSAVSGSVNVTVNNMAPIVLPASGVINTIAGSGTNSFSGDGGAAINAALSYPYGVAVDSAGNIYIADFANNRIRKVTASTDAITTVAGGGSGCSQETDSVGDGCPATSAKLNNPVGVAVDSAGNIYIGDFYNNRIRKVTASTGNITTFAGSGSGCSQETDSVGDGCPATSAELQNPAGVSVDSAGNIYIADSNNLRIRKVTASTGVISSVAAGLNYPWGVAVDSAGNIYIANSGANNVLVIYQGGAELASLIQLENSGGTPVVGDIYTVAGNTAGGSSGDGGVATSAELSHPFGVAVDNAGDIFIADFGNNRIRKVTASTGVITTVAGAGSGCSQETDSVGDGCPATSAELSNPTGVAVDSAGNFYIADQSNQRVRAVGAINPGADADHQRPIPEFRGGGIVGNYFWYRLRIVSGHKHSNLQRNCRLHFNLE